MNLFKIEVLHGAPKTSWTNIYGFLLVENDKEVYNYIKKLEYWDEDTEEETFNLYNENYEKIGTETFKEKVIRLKGTLNDEDLDWDDAYYGITAYGWKDLGEVSLEEMNVLNKFNLILEKEE